MECNDKEMQSEKQRRVRERQMEKDRARERQIKMENTKCNPMDLSSLLTLNKS